MNARRWDRLTSFVDCWYADELRIPEEAPEGNGPLALCEWFQIVSRLKHRQAFLTFPVKSRFARWPALPRKTSGLLNSDLERGVVEVIGCGGHGGWGISVHDSSEDPNVHCLELEGETSEPFSGSLSELLTHAVIQETICGAPLFGKRRQGAIAVDVEFGPKACAYLTGHTFQAWEDWLLGDVDVLAGANGDTLVLRDGGDLSVLTRTKAARAELERHIRQDRREAKRAREAEKRLKGQQKIEKLVGLEGVPASGPELLQALAQIEDRLLRFERVFLEDFRRQVTLGTASAGLLLKAGEILKARDK